MNCIVLLPTYSKNEKEAHEAIMDFIANASNDLYFTYLGPNEFISKLNDCIEGAIFLDLIDHSEAS